MNCSIVGLPIIVYLTYIYFANLRKFFDNNSIICNKKEAYSCEFASFLYLLSVSNYSETTSKGISTDTSLWNLIVAL